MYLVTFVVLRRDQITGSSPRLISNAIGHSGGVTSVATSKQHHDGSNRIDLPLVTDLTGITDKAGIIMRGRYFTDTIEEKIKKWGELN